MRVNNKKQSMRSQAHVNYMGGLNYDLSPFARLYFLTASAFFAEPAYYENAQQNLKYNYDILSKELGKFDDKFIELSSLNREEAIIKAVEESIAYDAELTMGYLAWLRNEAFIRTTPQVGLAIAAHMKELKGSGLVRKFGESIVSRLDDATSCLSYYINKFGKPIPNSLKRVLRDRIMSANEYEVAKYRGDGKQVSIKDIARLTHATSPVIDKLLADKIKLTGEVKTWESIISAKGASKATWEEAIPVMGHMALLRNLRNFEKHDVDYNLYADKLFDGVESGKQLPFRYYSAYQNVGSAKLQQLLERCMAKAMDNLPHLDGKTLVLVDNSGSARSATVSQFSDAHVCDAGNLMGMFTCMVSDNGDLGVFGDKLSIIPIAKNNSPLKTLDHIDAVGSTVGTATENGVWLAFDKIIRSQEKYDRIFIYSDMQAGHGGLYGINSKDYPIFPGSGNCIDIPKLLAKYRQTVNPDCFMYCVQIGGYADNVLPEYYPKTAILSGWSQEILRFAEFFEKGDKNIEDVFRKVVEKYV